MTEVDLVSLQEDFVAPVLVMADGAPYPLTLIVLVMAEGAPYPPNSADHGRWCVLTQHC